MYRATHRAEKTEASKKALALLNKLVKRSKKPFLLGLGSGSTMAIFASLLGKTKLKEKLKVVPSSSQIARIARKNKIKLISKGKPTIAIDSADQISKQGMLKGHGALAFVKEKQLDYAAKKAIFVINKSKLSTKLSLPVLVEVKKTGLHDFKKALSAFDCRIAKKVRHDSNIIFFLSFKSIQNPIQLEKKLNRLPAVIDNGIFANFKKRPLIVTD